MTESARRVILKNVLSSEQCDAIKRFSTEARLKWDPIHKTFQWTSQRPSWSQESVAWLTIPHPTIYCIWGGEEEPKTIGKVHKYRMVSVFSEWEVEVRMRVASSAILDFPNETQMASESCFLNTTNVNWNSYKIFWSLQHNKFLEEGRRKK